MLLFMLFIYTLYTLYVRLGVIHDWDDMTLVCIICIIIFICVNHVMGIVFLGPSTVGTPGMSHADFDFDLIASHILTKLFSLYLVLIMSNLLPVFGRSLLPVFLPHLIKKTFPPFFQLLHQTFTNELRVDVTKHCVLMIVACETDGDKLTEIMLEKFGVPGMGVFVCVWGYVCVCVCMCVSVCVCLYGLY